MIPSRSPTKVHKKRRPLIFIQQTPYFLQRKYGEWQPLPFSIKPAHKVEIQTLKKILRAHNHENSQHSDKPIGICNCDTLESTIVQIRHNHQEEQDADTDVFGPNHELLTGFATENHLVEQEQYMSTVECRNRQDVHEGEDDG